MGQDFQPFWSVSTEELLGVGLMSQLLSAIISIKLAHGAKEMAQKKIIKF